MYKVFINNRPLILTENPDKYKDLAFPKVKFENKKKLADLVSDFEKDKSATGLIIFHYDMDELYYYFRRLCKFVPAAGGVVYNKKGEVLFIFRRQKWDLPKGKIDKGENPFEAAIREVEEETGLARLKVVKKLPSTYHTYEEKGKRIFKKTYWFEMYSDYGGKLTPQLEEQITEVKWLKAEEIEIAESNTFKSIQEIIRKIIRPHYTFE